MDEFEKLLARSYNFLSYRPRSEHEVREYLVKKKADSATIERIVSSLKDSKFLDDIEFTKCFIEQRSKYKPKGMRLIKIELARKGISRELIDEVLEKEEVEIISDFEKAYMLAQKRILRLKNEDPKKTYEKLARYLASKGFNYETIKEVVEKVLK